MHISSERINTETVKIERKREKICEDKMHLPCGNMWMCVTNHFIITKGTNIVAFEHKWCRKIQRLLSVQKVKNTKDYKVWTPTKVSSQTSSCLRDWNNFSCQTAQCREKNSNGRHGSMSKEVAGIDQHVVDTGHWIIFYHHFHSFEASKWHRSIKFNLCFNKC